MKKQSALFHIAWIVTLAYCLLAAASACCILLWDQRLFDLGFLLMCTWMLNPVGLIVSVIGMIRERPKWFYIACLAVTTLCWLIAGTAIAKVC